jgi:ABC-type transport system substrate-binding protein
VYQSLVTLDGNALKNTGAINIVPMLASNWTISPDGLTYTFNLRNVSFTSGNPMNSYSLWGEFYGLYYLTANNSYWWLDYPVFNMNDSNFGPAVLAMMNSSGVVHPSQALLSIMQNQTWPIYVTSPSQIVFHLKAPFNYFLGTLVVFQGLVFDTQWLLDHGGFGPPGTYNSYFNNNPIPGTGPYVVTSVSTNSYIKFAQNPNYWAKSMSPAELAANAYLDPGHAQNVVIQVKADDFSRFTDLQGSTSSSPVMSTILDQNWPTVIGNPTKYDYSQVPQKSMLITGIALNVLRYPTNITAVRNAIYDAVNYSDINRTAYGGELYPWVGPEYPAWTQFYNLGGAPAWPTNVTKAQDLLTAACNNDSAACTKNFPTLDFRILQGCTFCLNTATIVQSNLKVLGINVNVEQTPSANYACATGGAQGVAGPCSFAASAAGNGTESQLTWLGAFTFAPGADTPADPWLGWVNGLTPANNWAIYSNPVVQKCDNEFTSTSNNATLIADCTAAQQQINHDTPYVWVGSLKLVDGSGSVVWQKSQITGGLLDPVYTGQSDTVIFNTVQFAGS